MIAISRNQQMSLGSTEASRQPPSSWGPPFERRLATKSLLGQNMMLTAAVSALLLAHAAALSPAAASLRALQATSGDDVRGVAAADVENPLLPESAYYVGLGFRAWLGSDDAIAMGRDPRLSGGAIGEAFAKGANALDVGLATTPAMLECCLDGDACGAVMVTASHLPAEWNGLKLFSRDLKRGLNKAEVKEVMALANELCEVVEPLDADVETNESGFMDAYVAKLRETIVKGAGLGGAPLKGLKICVNAGHGSGGFFAERVLAPLGADVSSSLNLNPDGTFPAHPANPEDKRHVAATVDAVAASGADVGVMLDTDVDRCGLIDGTRSPPEPVNQNRLVALAAAVALEAGPGVIVTDPVTSGGMREYIEARGGSLDRFKMGYRNVIDRAAETQPEPALLAIETSGHSAWRDNNFIDDGCYTAAKLLGRLAWERSKTPGAGFLDLLGDLVEARESIKVKIPVAGGLAAVPDAEKALCDALEACEAATESWAMEPINHDGLRCRVGAGDWLIARASLHEPVVSLQMEADESGGTAAICGTILPFLEKADGIDLADLRARAAA
mmetsp:Transcript_3825/g.11304  ORF Transcript_3825/g.11304 Transcript_3825/m.11304 type:complete len:560 (+) Transcript_3825:115-1794(+)